MKHLDFSKYKYELELHAIVDGAHVGRKNLVDDEEYAYNRNFMSELGFKSDSVGWIKEDTITEDVFEKILTKAQDENVKIRTICDIKIKDEESIEWYILNNLPFVELEEKKVPRTKKYIDAVKGYKLREHIYNTFGPCLISQKVNAILEELEVKGCYTKWIVDSGRYASKPFYELYLDEAIDGYFGGFVDERIIKKSKKELITFLEPISKVVSNIIENYPKRTDMTMLSVPMIVNRSLLEGKDIIMVDNHYLVSRRVKEELLKQKVISVRAFEPVLLCNDEETFVVFNDNSELSKLHKAVRKKNELLEDADVEKYREKQYNLYINSSRLPYEISEKMALHLLREEKRACPRFFSKGVRKEDVLETAIESLQSVYKISNGFYIGEECQIFSIEEQINAQVEFDSDYAKEQLTEVADDVKVIGKTVDGDWLILLKDGKVARYLMGEITYEEIWYSFWMFLDDMIKR